MIPDEALVKDYYDYRQQLDQMTADFREVITHPTYSLPFLQPGRLVKVKYMDMDFGWGIVINYQRRLSPKVNESKAVFIYALTCFVFCVEQTCGGLAPTRAIHRRCSAKLCRRVRYS